MSAKKLGLGEKLENGQTGAKSKLETTDDWVALDAEYKFEVSVNGETKTIEMDGKNEKSFAHLQKKIQDAFGEDKVKVTNTGSKVQIEAANNEAGSVSYTVLKGDASKGFKTAVGTEKVGADKGLDDIAKGGFKLDLSVKSAKEVKETLKTIDKAISTVSTQRSSLGAVQNRLEHTIKNLNNAAENTQSAEARIRDTDMAKEMSTFTKNNVLSQAAQAMISQANQIPNQALQLLR